MKKLIFITTLAFISCISCLPIVGILYKHAHTQKKWEAINARIFTLKQKQNHAQKIIESNTRLKQHTPHTQERLHASECLILLEKEREQLLSLPEDSLFAQSQEVCARKQFVSKNRLQWSVTCEGNATRIRLEREVEVDTHDLANIFTLFDTDHPQSLPAFFTLWEMKKIVTPLNNEVWSIHAEAISLCS